MDNGDRRGDRRGGRRADLLVRIAGVAVAVWAALVLGLYGVFLTPVRIGTVLVPVALAIAVGSNWVLIRFAFLVTGHRLLALLPGLAWVVIVFVASERTTEGDLLVYQSNWVSVAYLFVGPATIAVVGYRLMMRPPTFTGPSSPGPSSPGPSSPDPSASSRRGADREQ